VQVHVKENHQNGKDTHIRGIKLYALDEYSQGGPARELRGDLTGSLDPAGRLPMRSLGTDEDESLQQLLNSLDRYPVTRSRLGDGGFSDFPDFMRDPVIR
jgi:anaphase-promoting complex subunit 10